MLTDIQKKIVQSCAHDVELFFFIYNEINSDEDGVFFAEDERVNPEVIIKEVVYLINKGFLDCWDSKRSKMKEACEKDFDVYKNYNLTSFEEHIEKYGPIHLDLWF